MEVVTAFFFDAAGLSSFFFLEPDARAEDGEERLLGRELNDMELGDIAQNVNDENRAHIFWECRHHHSG